MLVNTFYIGKILGIWSVIELRQAILIEVENIEAAGVVIRIRYGEIGRQWA